MREDEKQCEWVFDWKWDDSNTIDNGMFSFNPTEMNGWTWAEHSSHERRWTTAHIRFGSRKSLDDRIDQHLTCMSTYQIDLYYSSYWFSSKYKQINDIGQCLEQRRNKIVNPI